MNNVNPRKEVESLPSAEYAPTKQIKVMANLSLNVNPRGMSLMALERLRNIEPHYISDYYPANEELVKIIAQTMNVSVENVLLTDGCDGAIQLFALTFISEGDKILIPTPTFHRYEFH